MSLLRRGQERRMYSGGAFTAGQNPFGPPFWTIPTNGQTAIVQGGGYAMSPETAMRHWAVFTCVRIISDFLAGLPIDAYTGSVGMKMGSSQRVDPKPVVLTRPSVYTTWVQWISQVMYSLLLNGNAYAMIAQTDRLGYPTQLELLNPTTVKPYIDDKTGEKRFRITAKGKSQDISVLQMWHLPGPQMPGDVAGLSPIAYASRLISLGNSVEQFGDDFFTNGIHPTAVATTDQPINPDQAQTIKDAIKRAVAGRDIPVVGQGVELKPWQVTPTDSMLIEVQKLNAVAIAQIYGIPPDMIGVSERGSTITYVNREQRAQELLDNTLAPWITRLEDGLSALFPRTTFVKFDTNVLLRNDMKTRFEAYQVALGGPNGSGVPFMVVDEVREFEDWPEMPETDTQEQGVPMDAAPANVVPMAAGGMK